MVRCVQEEWMQSLLHVNSSTLLCHPDKSVHAGVAAHCASFPAPPSKSSLILLMFFHPTSHPGALLQSFTQYNIPSDLVLLGFGFFNTAPCPVCLSPIRFLYVQQPEIPGRSCDALNEIVLISWLRFIKRHIRQHVGASGCKLWCLQTESLLYVSLCEPQTLMSHQISNPFLNPGVKSKFTGETASTSLDRCPLNPHMIFGAEFQSRRAKSEIILPTMQSEGECFVSIVVRQHIPTITIVEKNEVPY